jgi:tRNA(Ile)-lysidine synthase
VTSRLHSQVEATIRRHGLFAPGDRVGVAVSGGADSVALLRLLEDLRGGLGITLSILHFNHQLRGSQSDADEKFVQSLAQSCGLECLVERGDVSGAAKTNRWNLEDAGRRMRYEFFSRAVRDGRVSKIATAHTADDQAETVLARIIRGTGLTGLASIYPRFEHLARPLLEVRRESLRRFLTARKQEWREDESNQDQRRLRARLRHRLLPALEKEFSSSIVEKLCDVGGSARDDEALWLALVEDCSEKFVRETRAGLSIDAEDLLRPIAVSRLSVAGSPNPLLGLTQRLIRRLYAETAPADGQISRRHVDQVIEFAAGGQSGQSLDLPGGVRVEREFGRMIFRANETARRPKLPGRTSTAGSSYEYEVSLPRDAAGTCITIPELRRSFHLKLIDWPKRERDTNWETGALDAERLRNPLRLRNWRPGDAYRPSGRREPRKLKRMFADRHVAVTERALWPVLTCGRKVAWAEKMPPAAEFSADESTKTALWISAEG